MMNKNPLIKNTLCILLDCIYITELLSLSCAFHIEYICHLRGNRELTIKYAITLKAYLLKWVQNKVITKHSEALDMKVDKV